MSDFIERQHMFFVATAPSEGGHVNVSPKGLDSFRVLSPNRVAFLDLLGSGAETIAHLRDNGRITFMFCAFDGSAITYRLYGQGQVHLPGNTEFDKLRALYLGTVTEDEGAVRSVITAEIHRSSDSCGFGVPLMDHVADRDGLLRLGRETSAEELAAYQASTNTVSIDGLPAIDPPG